MKDILQMVAVGMVIALVALLVVRPYRIHGPSMLPEFKPGSLVLVEKLSYRFRNPARGEVIVFSSPLGEQHIGRVIKEVETRMYWVEGDNTEESTDSRQFGPVAKSDITGRVIWRVY